MSGKTSQQCVLVIMGAAVWSGGRASNAMRRRVQGALASAQTCSVAAFIPSGGVGKHPPSEASVMAGLLRESNVPVRQIILEESSHDTLSSVRNCVKLIKALHCSSKVIVCSDVYHIPRCRWLFYLYGVRSVGGKVQSGRRQNTLRRWIYYHVREIVAIPWDTAIVLTSRIRCSFGG